jgi:hypothetical protein
VHIFNGVTLKTVGSRTVTATDTTTSSINGTTTVTVTPAHATHFQLIFPSTVTKDQPYDLTVVALDAYGNIDTNYTGTVTFSSSDHNNNVVLPANYTFTPGDAGSHTFHGVKLHSRPQQTITVTDTMNSSISGTVIVQVVT